MRSATLLALAGLLSGCFPLGFTDRFPDEDCEVGDCLPDVGVFIEPDVSYAYVRIVDESDVDPDDGLAGVDICGVVVDCGDGSITGVFSDLVLGDGLVCDGTTREPPCQAGIDRQNPAAALDDGSQCRPADNDGPPSDSVSLGMTGELTIEFPVDLRGCTLSIVEGSSRQFEPYDEAYEVFVCYRAPSDGICARYRIPVGRFPSTGEVFGVEIPSE